MKRQLSSEYINDFLYFVIKPDEKSANGDLICCSGVNVDRFTPITQGRHNPMSNPAMRGLQLIQYDIMALALANGATAKTIPGYKDKALPPTAEIWSTDCLRIKNAPPSLPEKIINHSVVELLNKIDLASRREATLPDNLLSPDELQLFIESMCSKYATQAV
ncbi:MAG: hypothetical protein ABFR82_15100 [Nitrospirota bacterium]